MNGVGETCSLAALAATCLVKLITSSAKAPIVKFTVREGVGRCQTLGTAPCPALYRSVALG